MVFRNITLNNTDKFVNEDVIATMSKLGVMAAKLAYYNYEWRYDTLVVFNILHFIAMRSFFANYKKAVVIKKNRAILERRTQRPHIPQFVIFGQNSNEIADIFEWLIEFNYDNTGKYILVCSATDRSACDEQSLFPVLSHLFIANVIFLKLSNDNKNKDPVAYTIYPLQPNKCWNHEPVKLPDLTYDCVNDTCFKFKFPEKFNNLNKCPLIMSTFEQPPFMYLDNGTAGLEPSGGDGDILKLVANIMNATLIVKTPLDNAAWGHYHDHNWTGSLGDTYNKRTHAAMCSIPPTPSKFGNFQISFTYNTIDIVWTARLPALKPSWEKLLYPLSIYIRITLFLMFFVIIFLNTFTKTQLWTNIRSVVRISPPKANLLFYSWLLFLGMPTMKMPTKLCLRIIILTWLWFSIIIRSVYQGGLIGSLKLRAYESNLETFSDVLNKNYPFGGLTPLREYFSEDPEVYRKWVSMTLPEAYDALDKISVGGSNFVIAMNKETIVDYLIKYGGYRRLQIIPEKVANSPTVIYFKKNSHLTAPINRYLSITMEGGFTERLYARYVGQSKTLFKQSTINGPEALQLQHFTGCIFILILGWSLSVIFFVIEYVCGTK